MSRHQSSPAEQLLGLLFGAGAVIVAGLVLVARIISHRKESPARHCGAMDQSKHNAEEGDHNA